MPIDQPSAATDRRLIAVRVRGVRGSLAFEARVQPRFDYGRQQHRTQVEGESAVFETDASGCASQPRRDSSRTRTTSGIVDGRSGRARGLRARVGRRHPDASATARSCEPVLGDQRLLALGRALDVPRSLARNGHRSAITLKLMTYAPRARSSPLLLRTPRAGRRRANWDYRYTWVRDGSFSVRALLALGFTDEASAFGVWLRDRAEEQRGRGIGSAQDHVPRRRQLGSRRGDARPLRRLMGSRPVRIGNGAAGQLQLDIYGEALDSIFLLDSGRSV